MNKLSAGIKKLAVMLIACAMLLGVVPVGLVYRFETVSAEGEFLRIAPSQEAFVSAVSGETDKAGKELFKGVNLAGGQNKTYMKFNLDALDDMSASSVKKASLRLAVIETGAETSDYAELKYINDTEWDDRITYESRPAGDIGGKLADINMSEYRETGSVIEIDVIDYIKKCIRKRKFDISFCIDAQDGGLAAVIAGTDYEDKAFRPYLKIVTGDAADTDSTDLTKAWLENSYASYKNGAMYADCQNEIYLKFRFNRNNIQGAMYDIKLRANNTAASGGVLDVALISSGGESNDFNEYTEIPLGTVEANEGEWCMGVTDEINDLYARGADSVMFKISSPDGYAEIADDDAAPSLDIRATDSNRIVAVVEAGSAALGENPDAEHITQNLSTAYTAADGTKAFLKWYAYDMQSDKRIGGVLSPDGKITAPKWYEPAVCIRARAVITSGTFKAERSYNLIIRPQEKPNFADFKAEAYTNIGNEDEEKLSGAEFENAPIHNKRIDGDIVSYRSLSRGSIGIINMRTNPDECNYLTLKLRDDDFDIYALKIADANAGIDTETAFDLYSKTYDEAGFVYVTGLIPREWTDGRDTVCLILKIDETAEASTPLNLCAAYMGTKAAFVPAEYEKTIHE